MKRIVLMVIALLVLLAMPVIAHQTPPVAVNGFAVESPMAVAIDTDCLALKIEQAVLEKVFQDSNSHLSENLTQWIFYTTANLKSNGGIICYSYDWMDSIGYI